VFTTICPPKRTFARCRPLPLHYNYFQSK